MAADKSEDSFSIQTGLFAITALLLAALLTYGERETQSYESCTRSINSQITTEIKCCQSPSDSDSEEKLENQHDEKKNPEKERFRRLTSLIERRRARMSVRHSIKRNLIDPEEETSIDDVSDFKARVSPVNVPRWDPFSDQNEDSGHVPGSAPSILHHRKMPFGEFLPGTTQFSRLDPFLVTEMDLFKRRDATASLMSNHANIAHVRDVGLKDDSKDLHLKNGQHKHRGYDINAVVENVSMSETHEDISGNGFLNVENSETLLLSEYLNLCSSRSLPPRKEKTPANSFPSTKLEESETEPRVGKVNNAPDDTGSGVCDVNALDLETSIVEKNGENDENLEPAEVEVNNVPGASCSGAYNTNALVLETVKIEENGENDENLEFEEEASSVKEVKSILKQLREEIVKAEPNSGMVPESVCEANGSASDEMSMMVLPEPKVVEEGEDMDEENWSVTCEIGEAPESLLERSTLPSSITSNLKILRKQNKHGESSSSSSNDFD